MDHLGDLGTDRRIIIKCSKSYRFENRMLSMIFGTRSDKVNGDLRKLHNEEVRNLFPSPSIIRKIKSRNVRWAGYIASMGEKGMHVGFWWESQKGKKVKLSLYRPCRPLGLQDVEASTYSDIRLMGGDKVVSPTRRPLFNPRKIPGTHFC
jgi:hypothetical protein